MSNARVLTLAETLDACLKETVKAAKAVPPSAHLNQIKEGKATPLWLVGHLANTLNTVLWTWTFGQKPLFDHEFAYNFAPDFAKGKPITANPADYPSMEKVIEAYKAVGTKVIELAKSLDDSALPEAPRGNIPEDFKGFFSSIGVVLTIMILHDSHHRGQLVMLGKL